MEKQKQDVETRRFPPSTSPPKTQQPHVRFGPFEAMILASFIFTVHFQKDRVIEHDLCYQEGAADRHGESALTQK
jgi:hypothetical protein